VIHLSPDLVDIEPSLLQGLSPIPQESEEGEELSMGLGISHTPFRLGSALASLQIGTGNGEGRQSETFSSSNSSSHFSSNSSSHSSSEGVWEDTPHYTPRAGVGEIRGVKRANGESSLTLNVTHEGDGNIEEATASGSGSSKRLGEIKQGLPLIDTLRVWFDDWPRRRRAWNSYSDRWEAQYHRSFACDRHDFIHLVTITGSSLDGKLVSIYFANVGFTHNFIDNP
jgi:hypothetical protein